MASLTITMFSWDHRLETGIAELDFQHELIFRKAAAVLASAEDGETEPVIGRAIQFLVDYALIHFETEERYMRAAGYPDLHEHALVHARMARRIGEAADRFSEGGATADLIEDLETILRGWLRMHILEKDRALAEWLRAQGLPCPP
jgi:hemerythrin